MDEAAVKAQVLAHIRRASRRRPIIVTAELTLGRSCVRADLAVLADGDLIGLEIKTERDTLRRLSAQLNGYARFFDRAVVIAARCHLNAMKDLDLRGASLWTFDHNGIEVVSVGHQNPIAPLAHIELMTRDEKKGVSMISAMTVREHYFEVFARRYGQTSAAFWRSVSGRPIKPSDVKLLSRFTERREAIFAIAREKAEHWQRWSEAYANAAVGCPA